MRAILQRVNSASVSVGGELVSRIGPGLLILVGIGPEDTEEKAQTMAKKIAAMRIFHDENEKMNRSVVDIGGEALAVSQFTLYADTRKGNRPSFISAAPPEMAASLVDRFAEFLAAQGVPTRKGVFGAYMQVALENDGPVTISLEI